MPNELLLKTDLEKNNDNKNNEEKVNLEQEESEILVSLRVDKEEERRLEKTDLQSILTSSTATTEEKNNAYDKLTYLNTVLGEEEKLENKIKSKLNVDSFVEIDNNQINVIAISKNHDVKLANNIMRTVQEEYKEKVYVTVNFK